MTDKNKGCERACEKNNDKSSDESSEKALKGKISAADKLKFAGLVLFFLLMIVGSVAGVLYIKSIDSESLWVDLAQAIRDAGPFGVFICILLQFIQIVVAFIPGEVVQLAIGYVYGTIGGGLITLAGALISSIFVFYLARKLGAPFVQGMIGRSDSKRLQFLQNSKNLNTLMFILYLIPGLPKDLFGYVFPLTKVKPSAFFVLSTLGRAPAIFASTFVASSFESGNYLQMAVVAIIVGGLGILGIIYNQKITGFVDQVTAKLSPRNLKHEEESSSELSVEDSGERSSESSSS